MIRTVWLAAVCLAGLGGLCASKVTASISTPEDIPYQATADTGVAPDTLTAADKVDLTGLRPAVEVASALPARPIAIPSIKIRKIPASSLQRQAGAKASMIAARSKPRSTLRASKSGNPPRLAGDPGKCAQADGLTALIRSLTGTPHCG